MQHAFSVAEFCRDHGISRGLFYRLVREGRGPAIMKLNRRTLISREAAEEWRRHIESETAAAVGEAAQL